MVFIFFFGVPKLEHGDCLQVWKCFFFALPFKHHDMKVAWLDSGWMYCLYTFSQSLLSGYRGFGQATRWWGIPKKHRQAKRLEQHHRQGLDTFICTHHGHFHADEAQPNMTQCMFCTAFCGVFVFFCARFFTRTWTGSFFSLKRLFFWCGGDREQVMACVMLKCLDAELRLHRLPQ